MIYNDLGDRKYLTLDEWKSFLGAADGGNPENSTFCRFLAFTGCRISEALQVTPRAIDPELNAIRIRSLKKKDKSHVRSVPITEEFLKELQSLSAHSSIHEDEKIWRWSRTKAWMIVKRAMSEAELHGEFATPKGLRHSFGVHAIQSGVALNLVQRWMGHSKIETTAIYTNAIGKEERKIAQLLWSSWHKSTSND